MIVRVTSGAVIGIESYPVDVEVDLSPGLPQFSTVGLPDIAVRESKERIRAAIKNDFLDVLKKYQPDILGLQEVKIAEKDRDKAELDFPGYTEYWHSAERPGYAGTAILVKENSLLKFWN